MDTLTPSLAATLRQVRQARRLSQLELSLRLGVSQRHVSFVERGRARPSRKLLIAWLQDLDAPLVVRNKAMVQAGYAPIYGDAPLDDPALGQGNSALQQLLSAHDPMPALVIDAQWNLLRLNRGARWLATALVPGVDEWADTPAINLLDWLAHPEGFAKPIVNLHEVGPVLLAHLRHEAIAQPTLTPRVEAFAAMLQTRLGQSSLGVEWTAPTAPVLTTRYATQYGELAFFSMFTTFGTPQDITLASLRVEHLFAADATTDAVLRAQVP
ncbi:helix-turn-helix domain-containing protein [Leptolyngbya sp. KIOST-1]|uniref:helix-turn-helix domain-containing protein n=1 Tax=Leptolyngbya sp. KIOST-1 TaxID=1229172 RepID=UPI000568BC09|nr:helix-turn-helix transcriptional regulator [Leptolyngbya sp. KIOST-1]